MSELYENVHLEMEISMTCQNKTLDKKPVKLSILWSRSSKHTILQLLQSCNFIQLQGCSNIVPTGSKLKHCSNVATILNWIGSTRIILWMLDLSTLLGHWNYDFSFSTSSRKSTLGRQIYKRYSRVSLIVFIFFVDSSSHNILWML